MNKRVAIRLQAAFLSVSHTLILFVREGHSRGDRNAIARVDPGRCEPFSFQSRYHPTTRHQSPGRRIEGEIASTVDTSRDNVAISL